MNTRNNNILYLKWGFIMLIAGALIFLTGVSIPPVHWEFAIEEFLLSVANNPVAWKLQAGFMAAGVVVTIIAVELLTRGMEGQGGNGILLTVARVSYLTGGICWLLVSVFRFTPTPLVAMDFAQGIEIPRHFGNYQSGMFFLYSILAYSAIATLGVALWLKPICPKWVPYLFFVIGLGVIFLHFGYSPYHMPVIIHLPFLVLGITGLRWLKNHVNARE
jgi:hypothetical protein